MITFAGYVDSVSTQTLVLSKSDEGTVYKCLVDLPGVPNAAMSEIIVSFCEYRNPYDKESVYLDVAL